MPKTDVLHEADDDNFIQLVTFRIGQEEFGVNILEVQEIIRMMPITMVPNTPDFVEGVINLRGKVIPIIDMRKRFGLAAIERDSNTRIIDMNLHGQVVGFVVDTVSDTMRIKESTVEPPPPVVAGIGSEYMHGVGKIGDRLLVLLDLDKLLNPQEAESLNTVSGVTP